MSTVLLDKLPRSDSPITPTQVSRPFPRPATNSFLNRSTDNVLESQGPLPQSVSRPNSRRSSRIFTGGNLALTSDILAHSPLNYTSGNWVESPVKSESPISTGFGRAAGLGGGNGGHGRVHKPKESIENSWGVTSIGRGWDWKWTEDPAPVQLENSDNDNDNDDNNNVGIDDDDDEVVIGETDIVQPLPSTRPSTLATRALSLDVLPSYSIKNLKMTLSLADGILIPSDRSQPSTRPTTPGSMSSASEAPRYRRRSSQKRFSLVAGRLSYTPPPSPPPDSSTPPTASIKAPMLLRLPSTSSFMSVSSAIAPPPTPGRVHYAGDRSIAEFVIQGDVGRGAYGLVKRGREVLPDGSYGPELIIKEVIKSRILADCWKKHPTHGTIPIEIYVMLAVSSASYVLPKGRPWDPSRPSKDSTIDKSILDRSTPAWEEGKLYTGHPNICPLIDFFEDNFYYYLILPSCLPPPDAEPRPKDLFDLVEIHPQGLPTFLNRTYLGQIADALAFLHARGIVHRDIKDENVVLSADGLHCWLIDFGSSGVVRKGGWNSFSGTLDYASPEILRGEYYTGKEQDVWAFGVVAYVLLVGECPFGTATDAQAGLVEGFPAWEGLENRCANGNEQEGLEEDGGGTLADGAALVRACLKVDLTARPTFEEILQHRYLVGSSGWSGEVPPRSPASVNTDNSAN